MKKIISLLLVLLMTMSLTAGAFAETEGYGFENPEPHPGSFKTQGFANDEPAWYADLYLSGEEVDAVRAMNLRVAYEKPAESEFSEALIRGFSDACEYLNMEIVGITCCFNDPAIQKENMENFMALDLDAVVSQPQEIDIAAPSFKPLADAGVMLVFQSQVPTGLEYGKDYVGVACSDYYQYGYKMADSLAAGLNFEGTVASVKNAQVSPVNNIRDDAFVEKISEYEGIELVEVTGIETTEDTNTVVSALLTRYPDLDGLHVTFVEPATEALEVVRALGMKDLKMTTVDFNTMALLDMINDGNIYSLVVNRPYEMGKQLAMLVAYGALDKEKPSSTFIGPVVSVTLDTIEEEYRRGYGAELPAEIKEALDKVVAAQ